MSLVSVTTFLPLVGAAWILGLPGADDDEAAKSNARWTALWVTLVTFGCSVYMV